jgi:hypothetical protein
MIFNRKIAGRKIPHGSADPLPQAVDRIGQVLAALAAVEPPAALRHRILEAVHEQTLRPGQAGSGARWLALRQPWLAFSLVGAATLAGLGLMFTALLPVGSHSIQPPATAEIAPSHLPQAPPALGKPFLRVSHPLAPPHTRAWKIRATRDTAASPPAQLNEPAPPMPLTTEEKLLFQLARNLMSRPGALPSPEQNLRPSELQANRRGFFPEGRHEVGTLPGELLSIPIFPLPLIAWDTPPPVWPPLPAALPEVRVTTP